MIVIANKIDPRGISVINNLAGPASFFSEKLAAMEKRSKEVDEYLNFAAGDAKTLVHYYRDKIIGDDPHSFVGFGHCPICMLTAVAETTPDSFKL